MECNEMVLDYAFEILKGIRNMEEIHILKNGLTDDIHTAVREILNFYITFDGIPNLGYCVMYKETDDSVSYKGALPEKLKNEDKNWRYL